MKVLIAFLKERKRELCFYVVFAGIFAAVSYLYNVRMDAVRYAFLLSLVWLLLYGVLDGVRYVRRYREVSEIEQRLESGLEEMPEPAALIEEVYQRVIRKLYEAKTELESANRISRREMTDYYSMWVHQIKTPIAAMHILLQEQDTCQMDEGGLSEEEPGEDIRTFRFQMKSAGQYVREMKLELFKIEQYVEMVLTYLRMEEMSSDLAFEIYSLDSIIKQAVRKYSQMFILRKIRLVYVPVEKKVLTDEKWLGFVIEQILSNALKYTVSEDGHPSGKVSIYMKDYRQESCLVIEDTGIGIWPEDLPRVFEKGFTGYNGRTDKKSTGIGLYLCKSVMDRLRHQIWIESEVGKGTMVYLSLSRKSMRHE